MEAVSILININGTKKLSPCSHTIQAPRISVADPGSGREKISGPESGMEKMDKHPGSATLISG
jgi:hypothetical protein